MVEDEKSSSVNNPTIVRTIVARNNLFWNISNYAEQRQMLIWEICL